MKQYNRILFVAESGTSRAPMAAGILSEYTLKHQVTIECRGLVVLFPEPLNQKAEAVMISNGINWENFTSTQLEDEDFTEYQLSMKVTIRNDKIVSITDVSGDGDAANDSYIKKAANGTSSKKGVVSQIITKGMPEEIDTVSGATCSSNAIIDGCKKALEMALRPEETEAQ